MAEEFKKGDTVQLKSGGPIMTVYDVALDEAKRLMVYVTWFDGKKKMTDTFEPETLKHVSTAVGARPLHR